MEGLIAGPFAAVLEARRGELNEAVATARRSGADLDLDELAEVLASLVAPVVDVVHAAGQGFTDVVGRVLFDVALQLVGQHRMTGPVRDGWAILLPAVPGPLAADPYRVVGAVTNALVNLAAATGARPDEWLRRMVDVAPACADPETLLAAGQVAAWRSGMAAYRDGALALAASLPPDVLTGTLDADAGDLDRLRDDPWFDPAGPRRVGVVRVGAFRGFGGPFLRPPTVVAHDGVVVALDDGTGDAWFVLADAFGSAVVRYGQDHGPSVAELRAAVHTPATATPPEALAPIVELTSWADSPGGLVATSALSHAVLFVVGEG